MSAGPKHAPPTSAPWTEAHWREASACLYRIAENAAIRGDRATLRKAGCRAELDTIASEDGLRAALRCLLDGKVIDREVCRVRALAEGRLVRDTTWDVRLEAYGTVSHHPSADGAKIEASARRRGGVSARVVRVTRIRRAP